MDHWTRGAARWRRWTVWLVASLFTGVFLTLDVWVWAAGRSPWLAEHLRYPPPQGTAEDSAHS